MSDAAFVSEGKVPLLFVRNKHNTDYHLETCTSREDLVSTLEQMDYILDESVYLVEAVQYTLRRREEQATNPRDNEEIVNSTHF